MTTVDDDKVYSLVPEVCILLLIICILVFRYFQKCILINWNVLFMEYLLSCM